MIDENKEKNWENTLKKACKREWYKKYSSFEKAELINQISNQKDC